MLQPLKRKISFIFIHLKKRLRWGEGDVRIANPRSNFIIYKTKSNEKVTILKKLIMDRNYKKSGITGLKFKNQEMAL